MLSRPDYMPSSLADPGGVNGDAAVLLPEEFSYSRGHGRWASFIHVVDSLTERKVLQTAHLTDNEVAFSMATVSFASQGNKTFLVVDTGKDMIVCPRQFSAGSIHVYRFRDDGREI